MEFCPKCGGLLRPEKEKKSAYLLCRKCGFKKRLKKATGYTLTHKVDESKRREMVIVEEEPAPAPKKKKEELEAEREEYYDVFLETFEPEEGESETEEE